MGCVKPPSSRFFTLRGDIRQAALVFGRLLLEDGTVSSSSAVPTMPPVLESSAVSVPMGRPSLF